MKWLTPLLFAVACAGKSFEFSPPDQSSEVSSAGQGGEPSDTDVAGATQSAGTSGMSTSAGDGGALGTVLTDGGSSDHYAGSAGQGGSGGQATIIPSCDEIPYWSVNCMLDGPTEYIELEGMIYYCPKAPSDCNWHCAPPGGLREAYCDETDYVYILVGPCV